MTIRVGALLWPQTSSWPVLRDAAVRADKAGLDSLWTWDHLMAIVGPWEQPILEGWTTLAALAALTERVTLGLMVGANTFRNPGLTAKLATTLDHVSGGRAVLGIGGAWFEREHDAYGFDETWGSGFGERLDRLDESVMLLRRLLDGERIDEHVGRFYTMRDALCEPRPVQAHLPILIGGSGPNKTLRTTARYADAWNTSGTAEELSAKDAILRERCEEIGRNHEEIERRADEVGRHPAMWHIAHKARLTQLAPYDFGPLVPTGWPLASEKEVEQFLRALAPPKTHKRPHGT